MSSRFTAVSASARPLLTLAVALVAFASPSVTFANDPVAMSMPVTTASKPLTTPTKVPFAIDPYSAARAAAARGDDGEALANYIRVLAADPRNVRALAGAGESALRTGDAEAALGFYARADQLDPQSGTTKAGLAAALVAMDRPQDALQLFDEAVRLGAREGDIAGDRGLAYDLMGDPIRAQKDYAIALRNGQNPEIVRRLALSQGVSGKMAVALSTLDPLLRKQDRGAWRDRAFIIAMGGDAKAAQQSAALILPPSQVNVLSPYLGRMAALSPSERMRAVHFGVFPSDGATQSAASVAMIEDDSSQGLVPAGTPLGRAATTPQNDAAAYERAKSEVEAAAAIRAKAQAEAAAIAKAQAEAKARVKAEELAKAQARKAEQDRIAKAAQEAETIKLATAQKAEQDRLAKLALDAEDARKAELARLAKIAADAETARLADLARQAERDEAARIASQTAEAERRAQQSATASLPIPSPPIVTPPVETPPSTQIAAAPDTQTMPAISTPAPMTTTPVATPQVAMVGPMPDGTPLPSATVDTAPTPTPTPMPMQTPPAPTASQDDGLNIALPAIGPEEEARTAPSPIVKALTSDTPPPAPKVAKSEPAPAPIPPADKKPLTPKDSVKAKLDCTPDSKAKKGAKPKPGCESKVTLADAKPKKDTVTVCTPDPKAKKGTKPKQICEEVKPVCKPDPKTKRGTKAKLICEEPAAVIKRVKDEKAAKALKDSKAKDDTVTATKAGPERYWAQIASGANKADLGKSYGALKAKAPKLLSGRSAWTSPWKASNRLLVGPFPTADAAQAFVNQLSAAGVPGIQWTSRAGVAVTPLGGK